MKKTHTPDPWSLERDGIAIVMADQVVCGDGLAPDGAGLAERKANSRLIAAAPDLLAALDRLTFAAECRDNTAGDAARLIQVKAELRSAAEQARAAIAKVTDTPV